VKAPASVHNGESAATSSAEPYIMNLVDGHAVLASV